MNQKCSISSDVGFNFGEYLGKPFDIVHCILKVYIRKKKELVLDRQVGPTCVSGLFIREVPGWNLRWNIDCPDWRDGVHGFR
jgi:hypothetical protein